MCKVVKTLSKDWSEFLIDKPETGIGYQVVAITLRDGRKIDDVVIVESRMFGELRGYEDIPFEPKDVIDIELTHQKWKFKGL